MSKYVTVDIRHHTMHFSISFTLYRSLLSLQTKHTVKRSAPGLRQCLTVLSSQQMVVVVFLDRALSVSYIRILHVNQLGSDGLLHHYI